MKEHENPYWDNSHPDYKKGHRVAGRQDPANPWDPKDHGDEYSEHFQRGYNERLDKMRKK